MCEHHGIAHAAEEQAAETGKPVVVSLAGWHRRDIVRALWAGGAVLGMSGCADLAEALAPSDAELEPLAAQAWQQTKAETPISKDVRANQRLQAVGSKIAGVANLPNAQWEFVVFDSKELNAFCLPGGKVGFYKGLMDFVDNDDQVAAVLGHEVGHVALRHSAKRAGEAQLEAGIQGALSAATSGRLNQQQMGIAQSVFGMGASVLGSLPFSRANESEADLQGVEYMHSAGYDVKQAVKLWEKMNAAAGSRSPEFLSTHPNPSTRIADLKGYITSKGYATF